MSAQHGFFGNPAPQASSSGANSKRKRTSWCMEDFAYEQNKQMRIRSPRLDRRHTYQDAPPDLVPDSSATASDEDQGMDQDMDMACDADGDMDMGMDDSGNGGGFEYENGAVDARIREDNSSARQGMGYAFGASGSGGFGFGPGAMEDEDDEGSETSAKATYPCQPYTSLTPHTNPHHFSNLSNPSSLRPKSPLSAQAFSTSLRAPRTPGLLQPAMAGPLAPNATEVDRARAQHGPQCRSIPKLVMSQYADPGTGERSLWSQCGDCGAVERKM